MSDEDATPGEGEPTEGEPVEPAEGTPPEEEPTGEPSEDEPAEEPEDASGEPSPDEPSLEARKRQFDGEERRHRNALAKLVGEDFEKYSNCVVCGGQGYVPESPLKNDPKTEACPTCAGFGLTKTGSLHPEHELRQCPTCVGNGYVPKGEPEAPRIEAPAFAVTAGSNTSNPAPEPYPSAPPGYVLVPVPPPSAEVAA